jgi:hypothetical protein
MAARKITKQEILDVMDSARRRARKFRKDFRWLVDQQFIMYVNTGRKPGQ